MSLQAAGTEMNWLPPFSVLSHSINDADTLEHFVSRALPRCQSITQKETGKGGSSHCLAVPPERYPVGRGGSLQGRPGAGTRE